MLASKKCQQLARSLYAMANRIAYEDVQIAANQISQCAANAFNVNDENEYHMRKISIQAVNGPLQERMSVLDLDFSRANQLPEDYDTDLESPWSNPSEHSFPS